MDWLARYPWATEACREPAAYFRESPRETWGPGPWQDEPDYVRWTSAAGYPAAIRRSPVVGAFCGYVGVPEGHPYHGKDWRALELAVEPHGGLTYGGALDNLVERAWWLGFDCGHAGDQSPALEALLHSIRSPKYWAHYAAHGMPLPLEPFRGLGGTYRPLGYVRQEVEMLARELVAAAAGGAMLADALAAKEPLG